MFRLLEFFNDLVGGIGGCSTIISSIFTLKLTLFPDAPLKVGAMMVIVQVVSQFLLLLLPLLLLLGPFPLGGRGTTGIAMTKGRVDRRWHGVCTINGLEE
jgi:hypothetical protein